MIYIIKCNITNNCKIGFSKNPLKRLKELQTANASTLSLLFTVDGSIFEESYLHKYFHSYKVQGEWFNIPFLLDPEMIKEILNSYIPPQTNLELDPFTNSVPDSKKLIEVIYEETVSLNSQARQYIEEEFNSAEQGRIFQLCDMVKSCYNLLFDKRTQEYHTKDTLQEELDYTRNKFADFMKKLYRKSVIYYISGMKDGKNCTWVMLNPTLARKSKTIHEDCLGVFDDLRKKKKVKFNPDSFSLSNS
jgi:hypothetical protein